MTASDSKTFPLELLELGLEEKVHYFHAKTIEHPSIRAAIEQFLLAIVDALPDSLIFLFGPAGVGKSTLLRAAEARIVTRLRQQLEVDREIVPVVRKELTVLGNRGFVWSDTYRRLLGGLYEPLIEQKIIPRSKLDERGISGQNPSEEKYRLAYETALRHRRPVVVMLDDAHYLNKVGPARLLNQLDCIKTIVSQTHVPHALCGTYELLTLRNLSAQLGRRSNDIHFSRYNFDDAGREGFWIAVNTFQSHMPLHEKPNLLPHLEYLMEKSAGCVGLLKDWSERALVKALRAGKRTVAFEDFESTRYPDEVLARTFMEIAEGEERLSKGGPDYYEQLQKLRGSDEEVRGTSLADPSLESQQRKRTKKALPGRRNPARDPIYDPACSTVTA